MILLGRELLLLEVSPYFLHTGKVVIIYYCRSKAMITGILSNTKKQKPKTQRVVLGRFEKDGNFNTRTLSLYREFPRPLQAEQLECVRLVWQRGFEDLFVIFCFWESRTTLLYQQFSTTVNKKFPNFRKEKNMNDNVKNMIHFLAENETAKAKDVAKLILKEDTSAKNRSFCESALRKLNATPTMMELPHNIKNFVRAEDVSSSFIPSRYFLSSREEKLFREIERADKINGILAEKGIRYLNTTLLHGVSGTGKTTFGRYVAYKLGLPFLYLNFAECISSYMGATGHNIQMVFDYVKDQKCIFMIDEIDAIGLSRTNRANEMGEMNRVTISLMQSFDQLSNNVIILAATNRFDMLDPALKRRFTRQHEVSELLDEEIKAFSSRIFSDTGIEMTEEEIDAFVSEAPKKQAELANRITEKIIEKVAEVC